MGEPETVHELMTLANKATSAEEALQFVKDRDQGISRPQPGLNAGPSNKKRKNRPTRTGSGKKAKPEEIMANVPNKRSRPPRGQRKKPDAPEGSGKVWCEIHRTDNHSLDQCRIFKKHLQAEVEKLRRRSQREKIEASRNTRHLQSKSETLDYRVGCKICNRFPSRD